MRKQLISILILLFVSSSLFSAGGRVVRDVWNRDVEIPSVVTSIVALGSMGPRMASYLGVVDMLVGAEDLDINGMSARYDYSPVYHDELEKLPSVGKGAGSGENNAYVEELIMLQPDVIIAGFDKAACDELERTTGIPVVSIRYRMNGFVDEGFYRALRIFASVVGKEDRCEEILSYIDECKRDLSERTRDIPLKMKKRAYTGAVTFNGRHGFSFTYVNFPPFDAIGALNVADEYIGAEIASDVERAKSGNVAYVGNNGFYVDPEKIIEWNPDVIFLDPGNMDLVNAEINSNRAYFESLRAVREEEVYTMISTNSAGPNITYLIMNAYYAGKVLFPEAFEDVDFREKCSEIMHTMLGMDFFQQMEEEGMYFGKIKTR